METLVSHQADWGWVTVGEVQPLGTPGSLARCLTPFPAPGNDSGFFSYAPSCFSVQAAQFGRQALNQALLSLDVGFGAEDLAKSLPM